MWYVEVLPKTYNAVDQTFYDAIIYDNLVKTLDVGWLSKKLHMRGAHIFYYFGVPGYVAMMENMQQRSRWRVFTTPSLIKKYLNVSPFGNTLAVLFNSEVSMGPGES